MYNNSYEIENKIIVGTRGWLQTEDEEDVRLLKREALRLEMSIQDGIKKYQNQENGVQKEIIAFLHYPPVIAAREGRKEENIIIEILQKYQIKKCYYGHLHSHSIQDAVEGEYKGINFKLVSADGLDFKLLKI